MVRDGPGKPQTPTAVGAGFGGSIHHKSGATSDPSFGCGGTKQHPDHLAHDTAGGAKDPRSKQFRHLSLSFRLDNKQRLGAYKQREILIEPLISAGNLIDGAMQRQFESASSVAGMCTGSVFHLLLVGGTPPPRKYFLTASSCCCCRRTRNASSASNPITSSSRGRGIIPRDRRFAAAAVSSCRTAVVLGSFPAAPPPRPRISCARRRSSRHS